MAYDTEIFNKVAEAVFVNVTTARIRAFPITADTEVYGGLAHFEGFHTETIL